MRQTGAELLVLKPGDVTATQVQSENEANRCALQRIVEDFEDSLDQCLQFMAMWVNEPEGGHVTLFKDFGAANLAEASAELLLKSNQAGKLSDETYFGELKRRVSGISAKMLTERLRTLEGASLVRRDYEATIPPKVTYSLTARGHELDDVMGRLAEIGTRWEAEDAALRAQRAMALKAAE